MKNAWAAIQNAFSASSLAAIRNILSAAAFFVATLGIAGLTQTNLQHLVDLIMSLGAAIAALITAIGVVITAAMPVIAWFKSTFAAQKKAVGAQPNTIVVETSSEGATLKVANTIAAMPESNRVVSSPSVATAAPSDKVVSL